MGAPGTLQEVAVATAAAEGVLSLCLTCTQQHYCRATPTGTHIKVVYTPAGLYQYCLNRKI